MDVVETVIVGERIFYLVGTNHVSEESTALVEKAINTIKPDCVSIELDGKRYQRYTNPDEWAETDIIKVIKDNKLVLLFTNIIYGSLQRKLAKQKGTVQAGELKKAISCADKIGCKIELIDRDIQVTFKRMWRHLSFFKKFKLAVSCFTVFDDVEVEQIEDVLESESFDSIFVLLAKQFPTLYEDMIVDRDKIMATNLLNNSDKVNVVVLGQGHISGVKNYLANEQQFSIKDLTTIPKKKLGSILLNFLFPVLILILLVLSFYAGTKIGFEQLLRWLIWNGGLAAIFTCFALPNPLTIVTALITAPIGALSPVLSVGVFAALTEATLKKPTVNDFLNVQNDIFSMKTIYRNRLIKIGLVFLLANLGGAIGNIVGGLGILKNLI